MRQKRSDIFIPTFVKKKIKSVNIDWFRNFELSYFAAVSAEYSGFTEKKLYLLSAEDMIRGDVWSLLVSKDKKYSELDSTSHIILKFLNDNKDVPPGMERKYVFSIKGRSVKNEIPKNNNLTESILTETENGSKFDRLFDNFPNPFNPNTQIRYSLSSENFTKVKVYNLLGKEIVTLVNEKQKSGLHYVNFNGTDLPSGIYYYTISSGSPGEAGYFHATKKMMLIK